MNCQSYCTYLEVLFVSHLQSDDISTTITISGTTPWTPNGPDYSIFDTPEETYDAAYDPPLKTAYSVEGNKHFVGLPVIFCGSSYKS